MLKSNETNESFSFVMALETSRTIHNIFSDRYNMMQYIVFTMYYNYAVSNSGSYVEFV